MKVNTPECAVALRMLREARAKLKEIQARPWSQQNGVDHVHAQRELRDAADAVLVAFDAMGGMVDAFAAAAPPRRIP